MTHKECDTTNTPKTGRLLSYLFGSENDAKNKTNSTRLEGLFSECRKCNYNDISIKLNKIFGGSTNKNIINELLSPYGTSQQLLWMTIIWKNNSANAIQKRNFIKSLELEYKPNFNLTNKFNCNIIHDLCMNEEDVDNDTSILLLNYFIFHSKCIDIESFTKKDNNNRTPLHYAVASNKIECVDLLLRYYDKTHIYNIKDNNNKTIIQIAEDKPNILKLLKNNIINNNNYDVMQNYHDIEEKKSMDDENKEDIEIQKKVEEEKEKMEMEGKKIISSSFKKVTKMIENYDEKEFKKSIKKDSNKKHLKGLDLNKKQLKTSYCLESQTLEFIFHLKDINDNNKENEWKQPIPFWITFKMLDNMIIDHFKHILRNNNNNAINYKIGGLDIIKGDEYELFIKTIMNTIMQSNGIEQPFHIDIKTNTKTINQRHNASEIKKIVTDLFSFAKSLILPTKAVVPSYKKLYPLQVYDEKNKFIKEIDDEKDSNKYSKIQTITKSDLYAKMNKDQIININERLSITIPSTECMHGFKIKVYKINTDNINDVRCEILTDNKYIEKTNKNGLIIKWKLDKNYKYIKNENNKNQKLFKIYFYIKSLNIWCTGNKKQIDILNNGHPLIENNSYYISAKIYGAYDLHIRQQINFYDQYIDKFCFNTKYNKYYNDDDNGDNNKIKGGRPYFKPIGWKYYAINIDRNESNKNLMKTGCIGFHSTSLDILPSILRDGLVPPGTVLSMNGYRLSIPKGHITVDKIDGIDDDDFTNNIFLSPSINYCAYPSYCKAYKLSKYNENKYKNQYAHLALKVYVNPNAIRVNKETIDWTDNKHKIDPNYNNNEIEWRIRNPKDVLIAGFCIYQENITNHHVWIKKIKMKKNNNLLHIVRNVFDLKYAFKINIIDKSYNGNNKQSELNKYLLPTTLINDVEKMYLEQYNIDKDVICYDIKNNVLNPNKMIKEYDINKANSTIYINVYRVLINVCCVNQKNDNKIKQIEVDIDNISYHSFFEKVFNKKNINITQLKMMADNKSNINQSRYTEITQYSFNRYLKENYNENVVINIGQIPETPQIEITTRNTDYVELSITNTIDNNNIDHCQYKYELQDNETKQIEIGIANIVSNTNQIIKIKGFQPDKGYSIRIKIFNGVTDSQWSEWKQVSTFLIPFYLSITNISNETEIKTIKFSKHVLPSTLIKDIKQIYLDAIEQKEEIIQIEHVTLLYKNDTKCSMNDSKTLEYYNINENNSSIYAVTPEFNITIINKTDRNNQINIKLEKYVLPTISIEEIKKLYLEQLNINKNINKIKLFKNNNTNHDENQLKNIKLLNDYDINKNNAFIYEDNRKRKRIIRFNKYNLVKSSNADCIFGYNDNDYIDRARIGCSNGHSMIADTMYKHIETTLEKSNKAISISCPLCINQILNWKTCTQIADMNKNEYDKWTNLMDQRIKGEYQKCPFCKNDCKRISTHLKIKCNSCYGPNWCWECAQTWKHDGVWQCGNDDCLFVADTNKLLCEAPLIEMSYLQNGRCPRIRACPSCLALIEFQDACKHMRCWNCKAKFCFRCLCIKNEDETWPASCNNYSFDCSVAPRQVFK